MPPELDASALRFLERLGAHMDELVARIVERVLKTENADHGYRDVDPGELRGASERLARLAIAALVEQRGASDDERAAAAALGERRARQGVSLESVLHGFRVAAGEALVAIEGLPGFSDLDAVNTLRMASGLWAWVDEVSVEVGGGHRRVELALTRRDQQERAGFVHGLVRGTLSPQRLAAGATAFGLDPAAQHVVVRARPTPAHGPEDVERRLHPSVWSAGLVAAVDDDLVAVLPAAAEPDLPVPAGLGPPADLADVARSYRLAGRALDAALGYGLAGCHRLEDVPLRAAVLADPQVGQILEQRYLAPVRALGPFGDELLRSVRVFMDADQNVEAAARELIVHPNTLRHRLSRFEETTGTSLRNHEQLAELWWALARMTALTDQD